MLVANTLATRRGRTSWATGLTNRLTTGLTAAIGVLVGGLSIWGPPAAHAHFVLQDPPAYSIQNGSGSPQKSAPCGQADPGLPLQPSNVVTTFRQGQTFTLTINETVPHPGHYRVLIAADEKSLPPDPPVTSGATDCETTMITTNPTLPLIADGLFKHTAAFTSPQSVQVTLPPNFTCTKCTMQIVEFMSSHAFNNPGGCFYHHCATVSILPADDAGTGTDAGSSDDGGAGPVDAAVGENPPTGSTPSGGCSLGAVSTAAAAGPAASLLMLGLLFRRRRRR